MACVVPVKLGLKMSFAAVFERMEVALRLRRTQHGFRVLVFHDTRPDTCIVNDNST